MLEIIAVIFLTRKIGEIAVRKGQKKGMWQLFSVLSWIGGEVLGFVTCVFAFKTADLGPMFLLMYGFAIGAWLIVRAILSGKPDAEPETFDFENNPANPA